ncbi:lipoyl(octanoyl) transferase LipB [Isoptericola sp. b441]|uniref:Octanoyltransferase n=1 Tax=Actinotalea lenta TaxID=3064654 RepID=A0ABT9DAQ6_9CELL|nr:MULTISPECIES: lipoyl(octanoyl) transferase LipB [unclassified Isoptericola]MDO8107990.1 lipoyl(octanoyl) transferase LipB [Isoptericola sp. b441]MDO8120343.1 lipoyl(octanoyl) transferase LipB [Isoptericola sp. b490]
MPEPELTVLELPDRPVDYHAAWDQQRSVHARVAAGELPDTVLLVEHTSVYTAGKRTARSDRPIDGTPVVDVDRGGRITWHGPGQLVAYPIVRLIEPVDVVGYVRALEQAVMDVCGALAVPTIRVPGRSGVWCAADGDRPERKVAAIGVRVARGVTMHGLALNCDPDLSAFGRIVPCGIEDAGVTSLSAELGRGVTIAEVQPLLVDALRHALGPVRAAAGRTAGEPRALT